MIHEIGVVYKKGSDYFIAVTADLLVTYKRGVFVERKPVSRYSAIREMTVDTLAKIWKTDLKTIDNMSKKYFSLSGCHDSRPSQRSHRRRGADLSFDRAYRLMANWKGSRT